MNKLDRKRIYNSSHWKRLRLLKLSEEPLCRACKAEGIVEPAVDCDHIIPLAEGGQPYDYEGIQPLCRECHGRKTLNERRPIKAYLGACGPDGWPTDPRHHINGGNNQVSAEYQERAFPNDLKPSRIPLEIVCGPPGGGKSTYVRERATKEDLVIDLDQIMSMLSGLPEHMTLSKYLAPALEVRNNLLKGLSTNSTHKKAYFIVSAADPAERRRWQEALGGTITVIAPPLAECMRRIREDEARRGLHDRMILKARSWWDANPHMRPFQA